MQKIQFKQIFPSPRAMLRIVCYIIALSPFILALCTVFAIDRNLVQPVVSGKYFWFYGSMALVAPVIFVLGFVRKGQGSGVANNKGDNYRHSAIDNPLTGIKGVWRYFDVQTLAVLLFAAGVYLAALVLNDASQNTTKLYLFALIVILYFGFRSLCRLNAKVVPILVFCLILTGLAEAIWGQLQIFKILPTNNNLYLTTGSFFNPGPYSGYLALVMPLAIVEACRKNGLQAVRFISILTVIAILLVLPAAMSRAAWMATIAGGLVLGLKWIVDNGQVKEYCRNHKKQVRIACCALVLVFLAGFAGMYFLKKTSADGRLLIWKVAAMTAVKHPLGVGLGNFCGAYGDTQAGYFASGRATETEEYVTGYTEYGFNEYLQILVESGVVPFLLFAFIVARSFRSLFKRHAGMAGSLASLLVFAFFSYPFSILPFLIVLSFLLSACSQPPPSPEAANGAGERKTSRLTGIAGSILLAGACLFIVIHQYPTYKSWQDWRDLRAYGKSMFRDIFYEYESLYPHLNDNVLFLFDYGRLLLDEGHHEKSNEVFARASQICCDPVLYNFMGMNYQALKDYENAEACYLKSSRIVPNRLYPLHLLMKLYTEMGLPEKAREMAATVLEKKPKVPSQSVREMKEYVFQDDSLSLNSYRFLVNYISDADMNIEDIEMAVNTCRDDLESGKLPFDVFCEYVLPPIVYQEPFENWRKTCAEEYAFLKDSAIAYICDTINMQIGGKDYKFGEHPVSAFIMTWRQLRVLETGSCYHMAKTVLFPLRALGIPVSIDFIPCWATSTGSHAWNAVLIDGKTVPFVGLESVPGICNPFHINALEPDSALFVTRYPAKVFRKRFSSNPEIEALQKAMNAEDVPSFLSDNRIQDVSDEYFPVCDISIEDVPQAYDGDVVFLSVYSNTWQPTAATKKEKGQAAIFSKMKDNILYMFTARKGGKTILIGDPFTVSAGEKYVFHAEPDKPQSLTVRNFSEFIKEFWLDDRSFDEIKRQLDYKYDRNTFRERPVNGEIYMLYYWADNRWTVSGSEKAANNEIRFESVPANALLHLADKDGKRFGRCFTVENGEMKWW
jgi:tetratricopeptide (TPR) repeat protein